MKVAWLTPFEEPTFPTPPDPSDRAASKRCWEWRMMKWRNHIKAYLMNQPEESLHALVGDDFAE